MPARREDARASCSCPCRTPERAPGQRGQQRPCLARPGGHPAGPPAGNLPWSRVLRNSNRRRSGLSPPKWTARAARDGPNRARADWRLPLHPTHRMLRRDSPWSRSRRSSPLRRHVPWPAGQRIACGLLVVSAARGSGEKVAIWPKNSHLPGTPPALAHSGTEIFRKRFSSFPDTVLGWLVAHGLPSYPPDTGHGRFLCVPGMGPLSGITQGRARSAEATDI